MVVFETSFSVSYAHGVNPCFYQHFSRILASSTETADAVVKKNVIQMPTRPGDGQSPGFENKV